MSMRENAIREYISNIDFTKDDWKLSKIKEDMRKFLGEEPAIDIFYKKDVMVNEFTGEAKEISAINKLSIVFTDSEKGDNKFSKIEFLID